MKSPFRTHRAPAGLLASSRRAATRRAWIGPVVAAASGLVVGTALAWLLVQGRREDPDLRSVTLVYQAADAQQVAVAGSFNGWDAAGSQMVPMGGGLFRVVLWLPPGQYEYQFVVDGSHWTPDPLEPRHRDDGFGSANSVLDL